MSDAILCSGGWESAAVAVIARRPLLFFDYGQSYLKAETRAVAAIAESLGLPLTIERIAMGKERDGEIVPGRNFTFLDAAASLGVKRAWIGCRVPLPILDRYGDCNPIALRRHAAKLGMSVAMPLLLMPDFVVRFIATRSLEARIIFSSKGLVP